jgi:enolase
MEPLSLLASRDAICESLIRLGFATKDAELTMTPLTGGVSSDIWRVDLPSGAVCVKRALARLRVAQVWEAPVKRNAYEVAWMRSVAQIAPLAVPRVLGHDEKSGLFVMEYLDPTRYPLWKAQLRDGIAEIETARRVGALLAQVHAATARMPALREQFATDDIFYPIRLEPYLKATARVHPDLEARLCQLIDTTFATKLALVHGDASPKNILVGQQSPVMLDAECAWFGDPAFDLAFCLNHLLLKCLWTPSAREGFLGCFDALSVAYLVNVNWEPVQEMEKRTAHLLPGLFLARVDGKSPVEYINEETDRARVRRVTRALLGARCLGGGIAARCARRKRAMSKTQIATVIGRRVWDSRGRPTVEAEVRLVGGEIGRAIAPAGASTGSGEALDLRDGGERLGGYNVALAVENVNLEIADALTALDAADQTLVDRTLIALDGTDNRGHLGGNAMIAVSMACAHACAAAARLPLWKYLLGDRPPVIPLPEIQIFGGGAHAGRRVDIQDFMVVAPGAESVDEALEWTAEVYIAAGKLMAERGRLYGVADEGGYWPAFDTNEEALETLVRAIERAGYALGDQVAISLDIAASEFHRDGLYQIGLEKRELDADGLIDMLSRWLARYPIVSIEDPLAEDDPVGLKRFTQAWGGKVQIVGDDFLVTNAARVQKAAAAGICNAVLVKPNQAGTLTETRAAWEAAQAAGWGAIVSARSGETEDVTICHLAVGWGVQQLKVGSFARSERMAKWNELLRISSSAGSMRTFAGGGPLKRT